jgi:hypothetical protein
MTTCELQTGTQEIIDGLFPPGFFQINVDQLVEEQKKNKAAHRKSDHRVKRGQKPLLSGKDFILPELVGHAENGDLFVSIGSASDEPQLKQIFRLAERGEQPLETFAEISHAEQQLEKRRYSDFLKRVPKQELERNARLADLMTWQRGGDEANANFQQWFETKRRRRQSAFLRKANRLANCGYSGRRLDCRDHPDEHQYFSEFQCQCRYCRRCGANIFSGLFHKYLGLWPTVIGLLPANGFRSRVVVAQLDFTAVNLSRMPEAWEIREFNQDIRECMRRTLREMGIDSKQYGFLWCDEFGGWNPKTESHNTNLHTHGVYVGPPIPQRQLAKVWAEIRAERDGAIVVWISRQKIDNPPTDFLEGEHRRFIRALGHALKYTGKHVSRSDGERLADLEIAFHSVRRVHTMGLFYHVDLKCPSQCSRCNGRCELVNGHLGEHQCRSHGHENRCPLCDGYLMFPRDSGYAPISMLHKEGRLELGEVRRRVARDRVLQGPRGPDGSSDSPENLVSKV